MSSVRSKDTNVELQVRRGLHANGLRFRVHARRLPGNPDLALAKWHAVVFVNVCFWHGHDCDRFKLPKTNVEFWKQKIDRNRKRDSINRERLLRMGWRVLTIWECALRRASFEEIEAVIDEATQWIKNGADELEIEGNRRS